MCAWATWHTGPCHAARVAKRAPTLQRRSTSRTSASPKQPGGAEAEELSSKERISFTLVLSARAESTGPKTNDGLITVSLTPSRACKKNKKNSPSSTQRRVISLQSGGIRIIARRIR